ncbi:MAG: (d)CMP kinase [Clostridiales bacterium]|nr:(d)CMP kinase [Clostridiales bacterium]
MKAIRGATTLDIDSAQQIKERVKELLESICTQNSIEKEDIICIMFSNTSDIRSYYPAKAARECGFSGSALYSSLEPEIEGSLALCIRVMMFVDNDIVVKPVYLHGAANLRKDLTKKYNIALDGPAGSGKSTVSKLIAKKLNILCLDTGAMYRACGLKCHLSGVSVNDEKAVETILKNTQITVGYENGVQITYLDGKDVSSDIRKPEISMLASAVSAFPYVRYKMVEAQREIAKKTSCVLDGRDIGSNVLPNAEFKFFLTAKPEIRAKRRMEENAIKGFTQPFDEILADIIKRDEQDINRAVAPLVKAEDAVEVDSSYMSIDEVVNFILNKIQEKI